MAIALLVGTNIYYYSHQDKLIDLLKSQDIYGAIPAEAVVNKFFIYNLIAGILIIAIKQVNEKGNHCIIKNIHPFKDTF